MAFSIGRRRFVAGLSGTAVAWPLAARAQQPSMPLIGFLNSASPEAFTNQVAGFRRGLGQTGYVEGQNLAIEYRWADGHYERLPAMAADLVGRKVFVLAATGGIACALAAKAATTTIPIVFTTGADPIKAGIVASLNRPEGNITGVSFLFNTLGTKRLELLTQLAPRASTIGMLVNPANPNSELEAKDAQAAAQALGRKLLVVSAENENGIETAFAALVEQRAGALSVGGDPFFQIRRDQILTLAARHMMPAIYGLREDAAAGGLMSYGTSAGDAYRQAGVYVGSILKGNKPADLPVIQSTKFEFVLNLKTAKTLGLNVPPTLLAIADEVIE
jgi:ABC-type uncharacterized transport system substrate-binding protein